MKQKLAQIAIVVKDYDDAIDFYRDKLLFTVVEDTRLSETKRWVVITPSDEGGPNILLAKAVTPEQESRIGNQTGGRVFLFLHTNNFKAYFQHLVDAGVPIIREPHLEEYGQVAVFADLYGNLWDLIEPTSYR